MRALPAIGELLEVDAVLYVHVRLAGRSIHTAWIVLVTSGESRPLVDETIAISKRRGTGRKGSTGWTLEALDQTIEAARRQLETTTGGAKAHPAPVAATGTATHEIDRTSGSAGASGDSSDGEPPPKAGVTNPAPEIAEDRRDFPAHPVLLLAAGGGGGARYFEWHGGGWPDLRSHELPFAAQIRIGAEAFLLTEIDLPVLRDLGLAGSYTTTLGARSVLVDEEQPLRVGNSWRDWRIGVVFDDLLRDLVSGPLLRVSADYGQTHLGFSFPSGDARALQVPQVTYSSLRISGMIGWDFGWLRVAGGGGYCAVLSGGQVEDRLLPNADISGAHADLLIRVPIANGFAVDVRGGYTQFFYTNHTTPGDAYTVDGADDRFVEGHVGLSYAWYR